MKQRFNEKGMMIFPNPIKTRTPRAKKVLVVKNLFCPNKHSLITDRVKFNGHSGILIKIQKKQKTGLLALSPVYGEQNRISLDIDLSSGEILRLFCPACDTELPIHTPCSICGANLVSFFLTRDVDYANCIGICNRVDCVNASIIESGNLFSLSMIDSF